MTDTLFISDLHLSEAAPQVERGLAAFLERERGADALYVLGDIFEVWIGDDDDAPLVERIAHLFKQVVNSGTALYLMVGNRDFLLGQSFATRCGATLLDEQHVITLNGTPTLLLHGDTLCTDDTDYQAFRQLARSAAWQESVLAKSLAERRQLAAQIRMASRDAGSNKAEDIMDVNRETVEQTLSHYHVQQMIHGHTHRPKRHEHPQGTRWVLGDWDQLGWCLRANAQGLALESFAL
jgi:UDP-2,3-diacylglucosamine hydrolase